MRIAFYAPMKSPTHPTPSGDRAFARLLMRALRKSGHEVILASRFRSYDGVGSLDRQRQLLRRGKQALENAYRRLENQPPDLWFTYHLYHKAPDFIGPILSKRFGIPYVIADASHAPKQRKGKWASGYQAAEAAIKTADRLLCFDPLDAACLKEVRPTGVSIEPLLPFTAQRKPSQFEQGMARRDLAASLNLPTDMPWLITVAMMRDDAKSRSYEMLATVMKKLKNKEWALLIAGDGENRTQVEAQFGADLTVRFLGTLNGKSLSRLYAAGDIFVWPSLNEGCGMALLEAAASGLPVLSGARPGPEQFIIEGETGYLCQEGNVDALHKKLSFLLANPDHCKTLGNNGARLVSVNHSLDKASRRLNETLQPLCMENAA